MTILLRQPPTPELSFGSVCSGIEAASVAWHPLGWRAAFFSEIERFPCAVLAHHYPETPNLGDMTRFKEWPNAAPDVLVGGTPCQSFSVAGLRKGLRDPRGNLMLTFGAIATRYRPRWLVWENVPGVLSSDGGRDFGTFLGMLAELGYGFAYRVLDAQYFGLAQRRRRVFVVGCLGDWRRPAAVFLERAGLRGDSAPSREARETAPTIPSRSSAGGGLGTDFDCDGGLIHCADVAPTLNAHFGSKQGLENQHVDNGAGLFIAFDTTQITHPENRCNPQPGDPCHPLAAGAHAPAIAFDARQSDCIQYGDKTGPLDTDGHTMAIAYGGSSQDQFVSPDGVAPTLAHSSCTQGGHQPKLTSATGVRRLTPRECERLQGFPDDYTLIPYRGKPAADGPRYKALGNSMAVPVMRWIGERIALVDSI